MGILKRQRLIADSHLNGRAQFDGNGDLAGSLAVSGLPEKRGGALGKVAGVALVTARLTDGLEDHVVERHDVAALGRD